MGNPMGQSQKSCSYLLRLSLICIACAGSVICSDQFTTDKFSTDKFGIKAIRNRFRQSESEASKVFWTWRAPVERDKTSVKVPVSAEIERVSTLFDFSNLRNYKFPSLDRKKRSDVSEPPTKLSKGNGTKSIDVKKKSKNGDQKYPLPPPGNEKYHYHRFSNKGHNKSNEEKEENRGVGGQNVEGSGNSTNVPNKAKYHHKKRKHPTPPPGNEKYHFHRFSNFSHHHNKPKPVDQKQNMPVENQKVAENEEKPQTDAYVDSPQNDTNVDSAEDEEESEESLETGGLTNTTVAPKKVRNKLVKLELRYRKKKPVGRNITTVWTTTTLPPKSNPTKSSKKIKSNSTVRSPVKTTAKPLGTTSNGNKNQTASTTATPSERKLSIQEGGKQETSASSGNAKSKSNETQVGKENSDEKTKYRNDDPHNQEFIYGENSYSQKKNNITQPSGIDDAPNMNSTLVKNAADEDHERTEEAARKDQSKGSAISMADGESGRVNANAVSRTGNDAIATATNGSEANAWAASVDGAGTAMSTAYSYGNDGTTSAAMNQGNGTASSSALAKGENADAKSDAIANNNNSTASAKAEGGGDASSNALTTHDGHAIANSAAVKGGESNAASITKGKGDSKAGSVAEGGGNSTSLSKAADGNAGSDSMANNGGSAYSASWSGRNGSSKANARTVGKKGKSRAESLSQGTGNSSANAFQQKEGEESEKFDVKGAMKSMGASSGIDHFNHEFFSKTKKKDGTTAKPKSESKKNDKAESEGTESEKEEVEPDSEIDSEKENANDETTAEVEEKR